MLISGETPFFPARKRDASVIEEVIWRDVFDLATFFENDFFFLDFGFLRNRKVSRIEKEGDVLLWRCRGDEDRLIFPAGFENAKGKAHHVEQGFNQAHVVVCLADFTVNDSLGNLANGVVFVSSGRKLENTVF